MDDLSRFQEKAAELVLEDEAWRGQLPDEVSAPLVDWALRLTDAALQAQVTADPAAGEALGELAYAAAHQARALLRGISLLWESGSEQQLWSDLEPDLGPPLFDSPDAGREAVAEALVLAGHQVSEAASGTPDNDPDGLCPWE
jgi:hypothetical protein